MDDNSDDRSAGFARRIRRPAEQAGLQDRTTRYIRNSKTISGRLHDELVMMNLDHGRYYSLNNVATRIWDLLEKPLSVDDLCKLLTEEFDVLPEQCRTEVEGYLAEMIKQGLILKQPDNLSA